jgi:hypothetical protein
VSLARSLASDRSWRGARRPTRVRRRPALPVAVAAALLLAACGGDGAGTGSASTSRTLNVPADHATIQEAVDVARPGDLVLIAPGTYRESVWVTTDRIVLRGLERDTVVLDGGFELSDGILVAADGVAVENLTVQRYRQNGIIFSGAFAAAGRAGATSRGQNASARPMYGTGEDVVDGYRVSYVTVANNGLYGLYAFAARNGIFEHSYASGHPDSGFYVGQCRPCNALLEHLTAERNAIGYYGTNASGDVWVVRSTFRGNRLGIAPNSQDAELLAPQEDTWVVGNLVVDNADPDTPEIDMGYFGVGIAVGGGTSNTILRNRVEGHPGAGIIVQPLSTYDPLGNTVLGNVLADNGTDLVLRLRAAGSGSNCFAQNVFTTSDPERIEALLPCEGAARAWQPGGYLPPTAPPGRDVRTLPAPPSQPSMPDAATAPPRPAMGTPTFPDPDAIPVPTRS